MGTSMAHPQSLQSLQQAAGGYQVRPYPTAPANLSDGLQGYYGPPAAPAAPYGPAPLAASAVKPVGPTEPFNPSQPTPNMFQQTDNISSQLQGILDYSSPPSMAPYGPAPAAVSAVASSFRTPEQIQAQVNQAMYGQFNPFGQPTPNTVQQAQLPPAGLFAANPVDTTDLGQNFQTSVGQLQADEAAKEAALAQAPLDYEAAKAKWEEEAYSGYIGKGEDQENQKWNTKKEGELPPTKPGWFWQQADEDKDWKFALRPINEEDNSYWYDKRSGKPFQEYDEWFKQNVVMPTPTYTPPDNQNMATDIFTRR